MKENTVDVFNNYFDSKMETIHTLIPGKITLYTGHQTRKASVKPSVSLKSKSGGEIIMPVIDNVPVMFPSSNAFSLLYDIKPGDNCLIGFSETGIGNYLNSDGVSDVSADDNSRFSLTDAICIPGLWPFEAVTPSLSKFELTATQKYAWKNPAEDYATLMTDLINAIKAITTVGGPASQALSPASIAQFTALLTRFLTFLEVSV